MTKADSYDREYFDETKSEKSPAVLRTVITSTSHYLTPNSSILDIGCASGKLLEELRDLGYRDLTGIDISEYAVSQTRAKGFQKVVVANLQESTDLPGDHYDVVFMLDVIEHFTRPYDALREVLRLMKPGGVLIVTTPNANSILKYLLRERWALSDKTHVFYFTQFTISYLLQKVGFAVLSIQTRSYSYGPIAKLLMGLRTAGQIVAVARK